MIFRRNVTQMFSTFVLLEAGKFREWLTENKLRISIESSLIDSPEVADSGNFWALYWYKRWQKNLENLAKMHLMAYLQEPFYLAAERTVAKYQNSQYGLADYFQMANEEVEIIIKNFNTEISSSLRNLLLWQPRVA
jgi:hypothetical protein